MYYWYCVYALHMRYTCDRYRVLIYICNTLFIKHTHILILHLLLNHHYTTYSGIPQRGIMRLRFSSCLRADRESNTTITAYKRLYRIDKDLRKMLTFATLVDEIDMFPEVRSYVYYSMCEFCMCLLVYVYVCMHMYVYVRMYAYVCMYVCIFVLHVY